MHVLEEENRNKRAPDERRAFMVLGEPGLRWNVDDLMTYVLTKASAPVIGTY